MISYPFRNKLREGLISISLFFTISRKIKVNTSRITEHVPDIQTQGHKKTVVKYTKNIYRLIPSVPFVPSLPQTMSPVYEAT